MEVELQNRRIINSAPLEVVVLDTELHIMEVNPACLEKTQFSRDSILGQSANVLWDNQSLIKLREDLNRNRTFEGELTEYTSGGQPRSVYYRVSAIKNEFGQLEGYSAFGHPTTNINQPKTELQHHMDQIRQIQGAAMVSLAKLAETRDPETGQHLERIGNYSRLIAQELSTLPEYNHYITESYIQDIYSSSPLHDIGKVGIPDAILLKPGRLTPKEFEEMKLHSAIGGGALSAADQMLGGQSFLTLGKQIAYHHHEKWDGSGYPDGLKGTEIPLSARIVAIADVYDALTSKRVYKDAVSHDQARAIIIDSSGSHFAEDVVRVFLKRADDFLEIRKRYKD